MNQENTWKAFNIAFKQQSEIFRISKSFPSEEKYSLTDQVRRSSRSVCAALSEAYGKKRYLPHLILKLTDADAENEETKTWINIAYDCQYLSEESYKALKDLNSQVGKLLHFMLANPAKFSHL